MQTEFETETEPNYNNVDQQWKMCKKAKKRKIHRKERKDSYTEAKTGIKLAKQPFKKQSKTK